jgi:2-polyprenylphenol 6-hydroxylase
VGRCIHPPPLPPAYRSLQVWDALNDGVLRFDARDVAAGSMGGAMSQPRLGTLVENRVLQAALMEALQEHRAHAAGGSTSEGAPGVTVYCPANVASLTLPPPAHIGGAVSSAATPPPDATALPTVKLGDGTVLRARLLVGADGAASRVRSAAGIGVWGWDYDQRGVVATVKTTGAAGTAWQRFLPTGPLAVLPVSREEWGGGGGGGPRPTQRRGSPWSLSHPCRLPSHRGPHLAGS